MKKNKKPFDPNFPIKFAMVTGIITAVVTGVCLFIAFRLIDMGMSKFVLLPLVPYAVYFIACAIVTTHSVWKALKELPKPELREEIIDDETADYVEQPHNKIYGDDTRIGECYADR